MPFRIILTLFRLIGRNVWSFDKNEYIKDPDRNFVLAISVFWL